MAGAWASSCRPGHTANSTQLFLNVNLSSIGLSCTFPLWFLPGVIYVMEFNCELSWSWDTWSFLFLRAMFHITQAFNLDFLMSQWLDNILWFIFSSSLCFIPSCIPWTLEKNASQDMLAVLLPLFPLNPSHLMESTSASTSSTKPTWCFFSPAVSLPSDGSTSAPSSSHRMLFIILSCVLFSCAVLRTAWPCSWVLIPWTYFCVVLRCLLCRHMSYLAVSTSIWECQLSIFWLTKETYEIEHCKIICTPSSCQRL